ncbi:PLP-dependent aminotransferase family protein [Rhizobium sp. WYJ-E13]|uniref:MocR-like pyridoxine biosynthesis transcription factor PdxR n=1 Tax=Rhizobium sp. WYJ-E13 TaxID=2849093 RepID=UPI001C1EED67|nr:PLP-dependent aminotransferase family protein [Rhizobium sp. WYJ-E13]QWW70010.1 PLP-dependent aminotransferase family protein [Rhizobium sp. WYJ-E13]
MDKSLRLTVDRSNKLSLSEQIRGGIAKAIEEGVLQPGARLPSWQDLAVQLGVARGTVRTAYEKLAAAQLIEAFRAAGTHVAERPRAASKKELPPAEGSFLETYLEMTQGPALFQMGVPADYTFPSTLLARLRASAIRAETSAPPLYPDPRGELELRREISAYLAVARGINCSPSQVIITAGFAGGLGLTLNVLGLRGHNAWFEDPGFPWTRRALELADVLPVPIPVDGEGLDVDHGIRHHSEAKLVVVTPGQQAPFGATLSLQRRLRLLDWVQSNGAWIVEDDYLSELQLSGRAAPALASIDNSGRVIHIGSFSKTISPALRLGFVIAPAELASRFAEVAACLVPSPGPAVQLAISEFIREGHYMRHLRRTKRAYAAARQPIVDYFRDVLGPACVSAPGLSVLIRLPEGAPDVAISRETFTFGMFPAPLSPWYASAGTAEAGLLLGIATAPVKNVLRACERLLETTRQLL